MTNPTPILEVIKIAEAMMVLEREDDGGVPGFRLNVRGQLRWAAARKAIFVHVDAVRQLYTKALEDEQDKTEAGTKRAIESVDAALEGELIDLPLPPPIQAELIESLPIGGPTLFPVLAALSGVILSSDYDFGSDGQTSQPRTNGEQLEAVPRRTLAAAGT
jgi:hypothetical protein